MTKRIYGHFGAAALLGAMVVMLAACDDGQATRAVAIPDADRSHAPTAIPSQTMATSTSDLTGSAPASLGALEAIALQAVGEMLLPDGRVERQYRVRFRSGPDHLSAVQAEVAAATAGLEVVRGRLDLGDLVPSVSVLPPGTVTLRHAPDHPIALHDLHWRWHEHASPAARFGRFLSGPPEQLATLALRAFDVPNPASSVQLAGMLAPDATVGLVNQALRRANLRIAAMWPGNHTLTLSLVSGGSSPEGTRQALQALIASPAFDRVHALPALPVAATPPGIWGSAEAAALDDAAADFACED